MPVKRCTIDGVAGHKWGNKGVCFTGRDSANKAASVGRAIKAKKVRNNGQT